MRLRSLEMFLHYRAGIDFRRQNQTLTTKVDPRASMVKQISPEAVDRCNHGNETQFQVTELLTLSSLKLP